MSCQEGPPRLHLDAMDPEERQGFLAHLETCEACREAATRDDPTIAFSLLPPEEVSKAEVEAVQSAVRTLRRAKVVEGVRGTRLPWRWVAGVAAATLLVGMVMVPRFRQPAAEQDLPFSGAVGVGSGLIAMPEMSVPAEGSVLRVGFHLSAGTELVSTPSSVQPISQITIPVTGPGHIERDLPAGYRLRFDMQTEPGGQALELNRLELVRTADRGEQSLFVADLRAQMDRRLIIGPGAVPADQHTFWLELTWLPGSAVSPQKE